MRPEERPSMGEQARSVYRVRETTCPKCRRDMFAVTARWWQKTLKIWRRSRTCRACGYHDNEDVLLPIRDADKEFGSSNGTTPRNCIDPLPQRGIVQADADASS